MDAGIKFTFESTPGPTVQAEPGMDYGWVALSLQSAYAYGVAWLSYWLCFTIIG